MKLKELLQDLPAEQVISVEGPADLEIAEVRDDSRAVGPGDLFVALPGQTVDGHSYLPEVARRGAVAAVVEQAVAPEAFPGTRVRVASSPRALARIAARRFGNPAAAMRFIGITGTNGKTTTTFLVEAILRAAGRRPGVIGTVNYRYGDRVVPAPFTTPTPLELHAVLAEMRAAGVTHVVMETSSHALALDRLEGIEFRVGAFTNLTQDHLDFHGDMEAYFRAKARLLRERLYPGEGVGVVLVDGPYGQRMANEVVGERLLVSAKSDAADVYARTSACRIDGITAELASPMGSIRVRSRLIGHYNLENLALAVGIAVAAGIDVPSIERGIEALRGVPGRMEPVELAPTATSSTAGSMTTSATSSATPSATENARPRGCTVLVDYAHSHDALENVLAALRPITAGRILCVFGCGGDRDKKKRPKMGRAVARDADLCVVTSDNPRTEDPASIIEMILDGVKEVGSPVLDERQLRGAARGVYVEVDRRKAIFAAVAAARPGDVVLLAGKGHEDYQVLGKTRHPFDDRQVAREALALVAAGRQS